MSCSDVRPRLAEHLYGDLEGAERAAVERHLEACAACRAELEQIARTRHALDAWRPIEVPVEVHLEVTQPEEAASAAPKTPGPVQRFIARSRGAAERCVAGARAKAACMKPRVKDAARDAGKQCRKRGAAALASMANGMQKQADKLATPTGKAS